MSEARPDHRAPEPHELPSSSRMLGPILELGLHGPTPLVGAPSGGGSSRRLPRSAPQFSFWLLEGYR